MTSDPVSDHERLEELIRRVQRLERDMDELRKVCAESRATSTARRSSATSAVRGPYSCHVVLRIPNPLAPLFLRPRGGEPLRGPPDASRAAVGEPARRQLGAGGKGLREDVTEPAVAPPIRTKNGSNHPVSTAPGPGAVGHS
jgi:hypothetical protein